MSISVSVATAGVIPDSTTVKAYLKNQVVDTRRAPIGASVAEAETASGAVTLALEPATEYMVGAEVSSKWTYVHLTTPTGTATGKQVAASANTLTLPAGDFIEITGTTEIKKITIQKAGTRIYLKFKESVTVTKGENLKMSATFSATAEDVLAFISDGTNWLEMGSSANA